MTISDIVNDRIENPGVYNIRQIADFLNVDLYWLITGKMKKTEPVKINIKTGDNSQVSSISSTEINHIKGKEIIIGNIIDLAKNQSKGLKITKTSQELIELILQLTPKQQKVVKQLIVTFLDSDSNK